MSRFTESVIERWVRDLAGTSEEARIQLRRRGAFVTLPCAGARSQTDLPREEAPPPCANLRASQWLRPLRSP